ncbi:MAG: hypothetical protein HYV07_13630 [Deltaproteobacteria bacterium]|nr:hypothetical protein [Deltaproteobacteria bacterium]
MSAFRRILAVAALAIGIAVSPGGASAESLPPASPLGLGIILGDPTGLTLKSRLSQRNALQLHVGFAFGDEKKGRLSLILDYLFHFTGIPVESAGVLAPYLGIGGKLVLRESRDDVLFGVRVPIGLAFFIRSVPIEIAVEVAVGIHLIPETSALVDGGLMGRYYF